MSYQVLARKWRPRSFEEMVGQAHVVRALVNALNNERLHHAYLFAGTRGVGKTTLARIFAKSLNCERGVSARPCGTCSACEEIDQGRFVDLIEVDAASRTKVDETRDLLENVPYSPVRGRYKVYLIDEVHMFSNHSFNALLKTLEEPPPHVKFLLATTDPQKLPVTILSRCLQFNLKRMPQDQISEHLKTILERESVTFEPGALQHLARAADGSMRDALSLLDQAIAYGGGSVLEADVQGMLGTFGRDRLGRLLEALSERSGRRLLELVADLADEAADFSLLLQEMLSLLHRVALAQTVPEVVDGNNAEAAELKASAQRFSQADIQLFYQIGLIGRRDLPLAPDPRSGFEMILLRMLAFRPENSPREQDSDRVLPRSAEAATKVDLSPGGAVPGKPPPIDHPPPVRQVQSPRPMTGATERGGTAYNQATDWNAIVEALGLGGMALQLASNCVLERWTEDVVELRLDPAHVQLRSERVEARLIEAIRKYCGNEVRVSFSVQAPEAETPARRQAQARADRQRRAEEAIQSDAVVRALEDDLGAKLITDSIRPLGDEEQQA